MRVVSHPKKPSRAKAVKASAPFVDIPISTYRAPVATDNPRHIVLVAERSDEEPRRVTVRNPGDAQINIAGVIYAHTAEAASGQWIYTKVTA